MGRFKIVWAVHVQSVCITVLAYGANFALNKQPGAEVLGELGRKGALRWRLALFVPCTAYKQGRFDTCSKWHPATCSQTAGA